MPNVPNILSLLRIALIPILIGIFCLPYESAPLWATIVFVFVSLTDWLDGYLARRWRQVSSFGAFIDPVADKLLVIVALILILYKTPEPIVLIPIIIIIGREIIISALREWMAQLGERNALKVSDIGKVKTTLQMASITCLIFYDPLFGLPIFQIGIVLLYIAVVLTLSSMYFYIKSAWHILVANLDSIE